MVCIHCIIKCLPVTVYPVIVLHLSCLDWLLIYPLAQIQHKHAYFELYIHLRTLVCVFVICNPFYLENKKITERDECSPNAYCL